MLLLMKAEDRLEKHSAPGPITVSVRGGSNRFATPDETVGADARKDFACDAGVRHSLEALEAAAYLIGPATGGEQSRTRSSAVGRAPRGGVYHGLVSYGDVAAGRSTNGGGAST